ncbi:MAG: tRNA (adenosine(37)-N6)-threonylcarbamoyltransferase complex dimerization subunit type 1 TsaB [Lentisphaerae bacterium]|nr:tRNA (adenosine(37)-N6)-threonylcarbamoyltransferase complex dimerization subunit type 1 TsaB [Lentisphaerota bacterium]
MHILAIESSTPHASIALLRDGAILGISEWMSSRDAGNRPWEHASAILSQNRLSPDSVDLYAAGLGPGSYSGLRVSLMAIRGMAMPDYRSVCGVSSGEALAAALLVDQDIGTLAVVGDARRNRVWFALFERAADGTATIMGDYELTSCDELRTKLPAGTTIASPDIPSIGNALRESLGKEFNVLPNPAIPTASQVGIIALKRRMAGFALDSIPLRPIYLHPPVFVPPRAG